MERLNQKQWFSAVILSVWIAWTLLFFFSARAQGQDQTQPLNQRYNRILNLSRAGETWVRQWYVTDTALTFPQGGQAGFYRRVIRMGRTVPHTGRQGVLYLYPETRYDPARISQRDVNITQTTSLLVMGVSANKNPDGEWFLRINIDGEQLGEDVVITGEKGWQDIAFDLSHLLGCRVDIEIEAHASNRRSSHVYIDYINLEDPAAQPVPPMKSPKDGIILDTPAGESSYFDKQYQLFLKILRERDERRHQDMMDRQWADLHRKRP